MLVFSDIDGTAAWLSPAVAKKIKSVFGHDIHGDIHVYGPDNHNIPGATPCEVQIIQSFFWEPSTYAMATPVEGAAEALREIAERGWLGGYLTRRKAETNAVTAYWLGKYGFPYAPIYNALPGAASKSSAIPHQVFADGGQVVVVDDTASEVALLAGELPGHGFAILLGEGAEPPKGVTALPSWQRILEHLLGAEGR